MHPWFAAVPLNATICVHGRMAYGARNTSTDLRPPLCVRARVGGGGVQVWVSGLVRGVRGRHPPCARDRPVASENKLVGSFVLSNLKAPQGGRRPDIRVTFQLNEDGLLEVLRPGMGRGVEGCVVQCERNGEAEGCGGRGWGGNGGIFVDGWHTNSRCLYRSRGVH